MILIVEYKCDCRADIVALRNVFVFRINENKWKNEINDHF